jgi:hypothetical protein
METIIMPKIHRTTISTRILKCSELFARLNQDGTRSIALSTLGIATILCCTLTAPAAQSASVRSYSAVTGEPLSTEFTVKVQDLDVPVYLATVLAMTPELRLHADLQHFAEGDLGQSSFASFDLRAEANLSVTCPRAINSVRVLPSSSGIVPTFSGKHAILTISKPGQYVLEVNGDTVHSLQIFANPWDSDAPDKNDPRVIYFGPGIHKVQSVKVTTGQIVYVADGAFVYGLQSPQGAVLDLEGDNITVRGRGVIDGGLIPKGGSSMILVAGKNIRIEGVVLRDSPGWTVPIVGAENVSVKNVKIIGYRGNSDGIDINDSRNVVVDGCYIRTADDLVAIKTKIPEKGNTENVTVTHCVLWNEFAHALTVGQELRAPASKILFTESDVIHDKGREYLLEIQQADRGTIQDVIYDHIRIEECRWLISLWIGKTVFGHDPERGHINSVTFRDIESTVPARAGVPNHPNPTADLKGFDANHAIHSVLFSNVTIGGQPIHANQVLQEAFVDGVTVTP